MTLLPRSLAVRLTLILLAGLILAQLASVAIHWRDRDEVMRVLGGAFLVQRLVGVTKVLDRVPPDMREGVAHDLSTRKLKIGIEPSFPDVDEPSANNRFGMMLERRLHRDLGDDRSLRVVVSDLPMQPPRHLHHHRPPPPLNQVYAAIGLQDGSAVIFRGGILAGELEEGSWRLAVSLTVMVISILILTGLVVRIATRPLRILAKGAQALSEDLNRPPLPETGPREVVTAARALNRLQRSMQQNLAERSNMLAAVSHDLKTPLTRLRLRSEMLEDQDAAEKINQDLSDMEIMIDETLMFMRGMEKREQEQSLDVLQMLRDLVKDLGSEEKPVQVVSDQATVMCQVQPVALKRCFANLVGNALKFGGIAEIQVAQSREQLTVTVKDNGPGIPEQEMERVFEPFYRVERSRSRETGGTGMGLAIARNIARLHGGDIQLKNRPERGLEVRLQIPCHKSAT